MIAITDSHNKSNEYYLERIRELLLKIYNFDLQTYKQKFLRRRVQTVMYSERAESVEDYYQMLLENPEKISKLINSLSINVSGFFRNESVFKYLKELFAQNKARRIKRYKIWSMGCAKGEESYSMAMILDELDYKSAGMQAIIDASDMNEGIIKEAKEGIYHKKELSSVPKQYLKYFVSCGTDNYSIDARIRSNVRFKCENLLNIEPRYESFDMIVCRNVLIFMEKSHQELLFNLMNQSITGDGIIVLGLTENVPPKFANQWEALSLRLRIYKKK